MSKFQIQTPKIGCDIAILSLSEPLARPSSYVVDYVARWGYNAITNRTHVPPFRYLGCVLQCAVFPHTPAHHTIIRFARFCSFFSFFLRQSTTKLDLKHDPKTAYFLALVKPKREKTCLRQGASGGTPLPAGRRQGSWLRRDHQRPVWVHCAGI